jgi:hypothetical protein
MGVSLLTLARYRLHRADVDADLAAASAGAVPRAAS